MLSNTLLAVIFGGTAKPLFIAVIRLLGDGTSIVTTRF